MATMIDQQYEQAYRPALEAIAGLDGDHASGLNDVGFSRYDSALGHSLVEMTRPWSLGQAKAAYRILARYRNTQLPRLGFDFDALPEPVSDADREEIRSGVVPHDHETYQRPTGFARVSLEDGTATLAWSGDDPKFRARLSAVKAIPGARYNPKTKSWTLALGPLNRERLATMLTEFETMGAPFENATAVIETIHASEQQTVERLAASEAMDSDQPITGIFDADRMRPYQRAAVAFALANKRTIVADSPGLGKTLQSLATVTTAGCQRVLIICPASLKLNWYREIVMWIGKHETVYIGTGTKPKAELMPSRFTVVNWDIIDAWEPFLSAQPWDAVIADECHAAKSPKSARGKAFAEILKASKPEYILALTGTPILNRPIELFPLLKVIGGESAVGGYWSFVNRFCRATRTRFGLDTSGASNLDELNRILRSEGLMIRRRKEDVLTELPPMVWSTVPVRMTPKYMREYDAIERRAMQSDDPGAILSMIGELRQVTARAKMDEAKRWIDQFLDSGEKLVVFAWHREITVALAEHYGAPMIVGGMKSADVQAGKERFQNDPDCKLIICNIAAGGVGHTLTAASNTLFLEMSWNYALMDQALSRTHRLTQTADSVTGWVLTTERDDGKETIDTYLAEMIAGKKQITDQATDGIPATRQRGFLSRWLSKLKDQDTDTATGDNNDATI